MIAILFSLVISLSQLYVLNRFLRPNSAYTSICHLFLIYPILALQILPLTIDLLSPLKFELDTQVAMITAYMVNSFYFIVFIFMWAKVTDAKKIIEPNYSSALLYFIVLISTVFNLLSLLIYFKILDLNLEEIAFPFFGFLQGFSKFTPFFVVMFWAGNKKTVTYFGILGIIAYYISIIPTGHRGSLIMPTLLLIYYYPSLSLRKKLLISLLLLIAFIPISDYYKSLRIITNPSEKISSQTYQSNSFMDEVNFRLGENNRISIGIIKMIEKNGSVGSMPLFNAISTFIPAALYDGSKPWPASDDGTEFGILARRAHEFVYNEGWNMSEYMYPLHPLWEFGFIYLVINIAISVIWIIGIERVAKVIGDKSRVIVICSFLPFTYSIVIQPLVFILQSIAYITIPGIVVIMLIATFIYIINILKRSLVSIKNIQT